MPDLPLVYAGTDSDKMPVFLDVPGNILITGGYKGSDLIEQIAAELEGTGNIMVIAPRMSSDYAGPMVRELESANKTDIHYVVINDLSPPRAHEWFLNLRQSVLDIAARPKPAGRVHVVTRICGPIVYSLGEPLLRSFQTRIVVHPEENASVCGLLAKDGFPPGQLPARASSHRGLIFRPGLVPQQFMVRGW